MEKEEQKMWNKMVMRHWWVISILLLILLSGFILRIVKIQDFNLFEDEVWVVNIANNNLGDIMHETLINGYGTLHYIFSHYWIKIFGINEFYLRMSSILFSLGGIVLIFLICRYLFGDAAALLSAFLTSFSSFIILFSRTIRWYPMLYFIELLFLYNFLKCIKENRTRYWIVCLFLSILGVYIRYSIIFYISAAGLAALLLFKKEKKIIINWVYFQIILIVAFLALLSPYLHGILMQFISEKYIFDRAPVLFGTPGKILYIIYSFWYGQNIMPYVYPIVIVGFFVFCAILNKFIFIYRNSPFHLKKNINVLLIFFLTPILFSSFSKHSAPHYYMSAASLLMTFVSLSILSYKKKLFRIIIFILIVIVQSYSLYNLYTKRQYFRGEFVDSWKEMASYITENLEPYDAVLYEQIAFGYYFRKINPASERFSLETTTSGLLNIEERILKNRDFKRIWFINSPLSMYMPFNPTEDTSFSQLLAKYNFKLMDIVNFDEDVDAEFKRKIIKRPFSRFRNTIYIFVKTD